MAVTVRTVDGAEERIEVRPGTCADVIVDLGLCDLPSGRFRVWFGDTDVASRELFQFDGKLLVVARIGIHPSTSVSPRVPLSLQTGQGEIRATSLPTTAAPAGPRPPDPRFEPVFAFLYGLKCAARALFRAVPVTLVYWLLLLLAAFIGGGLLALVALGAAVALAFVVGWLGSQGHMRAPRATFMESLFGRVCAVAGIVATLSLGFGGVGRAPLDVLRDATRTTSSRTSRNSTPRAQAPTAARNKPTGRPSGRPSTPKPITPARPTFPASAKGAAPSGASSLASEQATQIQPNSPRAALPLNPTLRQGTIQARPASPVGSRRAAPPRGRPSSAMPAGRPGATSLARAPTFPAKPELKPAPVRPAESKSVPADVPETPVRAQPPVLAEPEKLRSEQQVVESAPAPAPAARTPVTVTVHIAAYPGNCVVSIDGKPAGTTPFDYPLLTGPHEFTFTWPTIGRSRTFRRTIVEGDSLFITTGPGK